MGHIVRRVAWLFAFGIAPVVAAQSLTSTLGNIQGPPELTGEAKRESDYNIRMHHEYRARAERELWREHGGEAGLRERAVAELIAAGEPIHQYQRVEIKGFWEPKSTPEDENARFFQVTVPLSHLREPAAPGWWSRATTRALNFFRGAGDVFDELKSERRGALSEQARRAIADKGLVGATINEVWAHSWGTEAVYAAIFERQLLPPRRLVLMGVPTRNLAKWQALARATGTEVLIFGHDEEFVSRGFKLPLPGFADRVTITVDDLPGAQVTHDPDELAHLWNAWVLATPPGQRRPIAGTAQVVWNTLADHETHFRGHYYRHMLETQTWAVPWSALHQEQQRRIERRMERIVDERTQALLKSDPPAPYRSQLYEQLVARPVPPPMIAVAAMAYTPSTVECIKAALPFVCSASRPIDRLPSACGAAATAMHVPSGALAQAAGAFQPGSCERRLLEQLRDPSASATSFDYATLETLASMAAAINAPSVQQSSGSPSAGDDDFKCEVVCGDTMECTTHFENKCISGACFDFPRQTCRKARVCETVCD